jgi:hypothetical protein
MSDKSTPGDKLKELYKQVSVLSDDFPAELIKKLSLYGKILELTGKLHAASLKDWKLAEATRKETIATVYSLDPQKTVKDKEYKAEMAAAPYRRQEAEAEAECMRWRNAYTSTVEMIQIIKVQIKDIQENLKGGV